jgi:hypothetical protein
MKQQPSVTSGVSDEVFRIFCVSIMWKGVSICLIPIFYPMLALEKGVDLYLIGVVLSFSPLISIISTPFVNCFINYAGAEKVIFSGGVCYVIANLGLSAVVYFAKLYFLELSVIF